MVAGWYTRLHAACRQPVDAAGVEVFRALFGALMLLAVIRYWAYGWIDSIVIRPDYHFSYAGFRWVMPLPGALSYLHFALIAVAALCLMLGIYTRLSATVFFVLFTWAELIEKAAYLNHYYLVSILALLLVFIPTQGWPIQGWLRGYGLRGSRRKAHSGQAGQSRQEQDGRVGQWVYGLLRAQVALVYFFAAVAKLNGDWLLQAQPLYTWLQAYQHWPLVGPLLAGKAGALALSWTGLLFDATVWIGLSFRRTRAIAYAAAVVFHVTTWLLFPIGMFPWVMLLAITIFFPPSWPRRWLERLAPQSIAETDADESAPQLALKPAAAQSAPHPTQLSRGGMLLAALWLSIQLLLPLRHWLYPGPVNWTEEGFRFSWRVMLIEKTGQIEYRIKTGASEHVRRVYPRKHLTPLQYRMLSTQFDMMLEYAHELARSYRAAGHEHVEVYADVFVSFNGRPSQRAVDPTVDLATEPLSSWSHARWILPLAERDREP